MRVLEVSLRKAGFTVTTAVSVADALDKLELHAPDLIISETTFPDGDGFDLRRRVRSTPDWAEIPFIFLTAEGAIENKIRGLELGVDDYLTKPIYIKEIVTRINILLQKRQRVRFEERRDGRTRFAGRVADMPVVDVIQTIEISRKSGVIQFVGDRGRQAAIYFRDGRVIDAEAGALQGEDAVYRLLTWNEGEFEVVFRTVRRREVIATSSQSLLMEGMRRLDEWSRLLEQLPALGHRFEVDAAELAVRLGDVPDDNNRILRLIDGKRSLMEVIDASDFGDLECLQAISRLYFEELLIDLDHGAPARRDTGKPMPLVEIEAASPISDVASGPISDRAPSRLEPVSQVDELDDDDHEPDVISEEPLPGALLGGYRPSSLRLIDEAVAAAQAIEPSLFEDEAAPTEIDPNDVLEVDETGRGNGSMASNVEAAREDARSSAGAGLGTSGRGRDSDDSSPWFATGSARTGPPTGTAAASTASSADNEGSSESEAISDGTVTPFEVRIAGAATLSFESGRAGRAPSESGEVPRASESGGIRRAPSESGEVPRASESGGIRRAPSESGGVPRASESGEIRRAPSESSGAPRASESGGIRRPSSEMPEGEATRRPSLQADAAGDALPRRFGSGLMHSATASQRDAAAKATTRQALPVREVIASSEMASARRAPSELPAGADAAASLPPSTERVEIKPSRRAGSQSDVKAIAAAGEATEEDLAIATWQTAPARQARAASGLRPESELTAESLFGDLDLQTRGEVSDAASTAQELAIVANSLATKLPTPSATPAEQGGSHAALRGTATTATEDGSATTAAHGAWPGVIAQSPGVGPRATAEDPALADDAGPGTTEQRLEADAGPGTTGRADNVGSAASEPGADATAQGPAGAARRGATATDTEPSTAQDPALAESSGLTAIARGPAAADTSGPTATVRGPAFGVEHGRPRASSASEVTARRDVVANESDESTIGGDDPAPPPRNTPRGLGRDEMSLRMIGSLGRDRAEASGELVPLGSPPPQLSETQRELVTILPRRITRELAVPTQAVEPATPVEPPREEPMREPPPPAVSRESVEGSGVVRRATGPGAGALVLIGLAAVLAGIAVYLRVKRAPRVEPVAIVADASIEATPGPDPLTDAQSAVAIAPADADEIEIDMGVDAAAPPDATDNVQQAKALAEQAHEAIQEGAFDRALQLADASLKLRRTARTYLVRAQALQRLDRVDEALDAIDLAEKVAPQFATVYEQRGRILWAARRKDEAREAFEKFLQLEPEGPRAAQIQRLLNEPR